MAAYEAMILAAGRGTRMQPHVKDKPKPLVEIGRKPLIDYALELLTRSGISGCVVNTHHLAEQINAHLATHRELEITLSHEPELLETGGGIRKALPLLQEQFFTLNSDVICVESPGSPVLSQMRAEWRPQAMDSLMLLCPLERAIGYQGEGDFSLSETGQLQPRQPGKPAYVYMGIQYMHRRFLDGTAPGAFSLSPLYQQQLAKGEQCRLYGKVHEGSWLHVGCPEGVALAEDYLLDSVVKFASMCRE